MKKRMVTSVPVRGLPTDLVEPHYIYYDCPGCGNEMKLHSSMMQTNELVECGCGYKFKVGDELRGK